MTVSRSAKVFVYARNSNYPCIAATSSATGSEMSGKKNATSTLLAIIVPLSVMLLIVIVITVVIIVVIIKWRGKETHSKVHQSERS